MGKTRRIIKLSIMLAAALPLVSGCSLGSPQPEKVVAGFIQALVKKDFNKAYGFISEEDRKSLDRETFAKKYLILAEVFPISKYEIKKANIRDQQAQVILDFQGPDWREAYWMVIQSAFVPEKPDDFQAVSAEEIVQRTIEKIKAPDFPQVKRELPFGLVREKKKWKIFFNVQLENSVSERFREAAELSKEGKYEAAEETVERILRIDPYNKSAREFLEKIRSHKFQQPPKK